MNEPFIDLNSPRGQKQLPIGAGPVTVGRNFTNLLVVEDDQASRFHCVVEKIPEGFRVRDLDSRNGTRVNGKPVKSAVLKPGDAIQIGKTTLTLRVPSSVKTVPSRHTAPPAPEPVSENFDFIAEDEIEEIEEVDASDEIGADEIPEQTEEPDELAVFDDEDAMAVDVSDDVDVQVPLGDYEQAMLRMSDLLPDKPFDADDITLINARGVVAHAGRGMQASGKRKAESVGETVGLWRLVLLICFRSRASDIHVEPRNEDTQVRIRVDGTMVDVVTTPKDVGVKLTSLVKILSDIDISQRNSIQEGHFTAKVPEHGQMRRVDYRVSFAPAMFGQKLVVRIFDTASAPLHLSDLKLPEWMHDEIKRAIEGDSGMILVCGPTGSGKTTTLYSLLRDIDSGERNVLTIEDPVEVQLDRITQIPVKDDQGNTFSALLRSVLRQDPDAIMVGEIRDAETARIAMQAAMTGHLVFSTVHARDTIGTVFRLLDLGVEPYLVSQGLHVVLAQRLVRRLCTYCKKAVRPTQHQLDRMGQAGQGCTKIFTKVGCPRCMKTGYAGRCGVYELLVTSEKLRDVLMKSPNMGDIQNALGGTKFVKLSQSGYLLVAQGTSTFEEIDRAVG